MLNLDQSTSRAEAQTKKSATLLCIQAVSAAASYGNARSLALPGNTCLGMCGRRLYAALDARAWCAPRAPASGTVMRRA